MGAFILRLVQFQLVQGEELLEKAQQVSNYLFSIPAARGEIVDEYGRAMASNVSGYNLVINKLMLTGDLNETLVELVEILQAGGDEWNDTMPISAPENGHYEFTAGEDDSRAQSRLDALKENLVKQPYATADQVMAAVVERYELEDYSPGWQRILGGIRYQMELEEFSDNNNFTLAEDVSSRTVATVKERGLTSEGADITETSYRVYADGTLAPHLLGYVGPIYAEDWKVTDEEGNVSYPLKEKGYAMNDTIGQAGLEQVGEDKLRGEDGIKQVTRDKDGVIISTEVIQDPQPGLTMVTTINADLQKKVYEALENQILNLQATAEQYKGKEASAKEEAGYSTFQIANEMLARGIEVLPVDLYKSDAKKYVVENGKIRLPFSSLAGVGEAAANALAEARETGARISPLTTCRRALRCPKRSLKCWSRPAP